ncbi:MAG: hypothetical protein AAF432_08245 [Planctomycetota bacterium]
MPRLHDEPESNDAPRCRLSNCVLSIAIACWIVVIVGGFLGLTRYSTVPGATAATPATWPVAANLTPATSTTTVILFAHPHCPCTLATFAELRRALAHAPADVRTTVVFGRPADAQDDWAHGRLWTLVSSANDIDFRIDPDGVEAATFGAKTSGHCLVYAPDGTLRFSGGITSARGHEGANAGRRAMIEALRGPLESTANSPVFGCPLMQPHNANLPFADDCAVPHG